MSSPTISGTLAGQTSTDQASLTPFAGVTISDDAGQIETVTVTLSSGANGTLTNLGSGTYDANNGTYTDIGNAAAVTADLDGLVFTPAMATPGTSVTTTFAISDTDTASATAADSTTSVIVTSGPAISGVLSGQTTSDQTSVMPFADVTITDDPGQTETVTITLSSAANGTLGQLGGGSYNAGTGMYTVTGDAATVTADLNQLVFTPAQGTPGVSVTTSFTISDIDTDLVSASDNSTTVIVTAGPTITGSLNGQQINDQTSITPFANLVIGDDAGQIETVRVTLSNAANGTLTTLGGGSYNAATGIYTDTGTSAAVTADLNQLVFMPTQGTPGQSVTTTFVITDVDSASVSATDNNTTVIVSSGPTITGTTPGQQTTDQSSILPFAGVVIADEVGQTETVTVTPSSAANGTLTNLGIGSYNASTGVFTDSGSAASVTADLNHLVFTPAQGTPGQSVTTTFAISDIDTASVSANDSTTSVIAAAGPVISGTQANQLGTDQTTLLPFAGVTITDDPGQVESVTITLSAAADGVLTNLGSGSYNTQSGIYTDSGSAASVTADLDQLIFVPAAGTPGQSVTTTFSISDVDTASATANDSTTSVVVTSGPSITGTVGGQTTVNQSAIAPFANVIINDDPQQTETLTVTLSSAANGALTNLGNGSYDAQAGVYTDMGSAASVTADLEALQFIPASGTPGQAVTTSFVISDIDAANATATDATTSVIDGIGPSITGAVAGQTATDQTTLTPFSTVVITDDPSQTDTVTVMLSDPGNGTLTNTGSGSYDAQTGTWTDVGLASAVTSDLQALVFTPSQGTPGQNTTTVFTIHDIDTANASVSDNTTSVITASGPAVTGTMAGQTVSNAGTVHPFANVVITDNPGQIENVSITLSNASDGTISHLGSGSYDAINGIYSDTGSAAAVMTDLHALVFTPNPGTAGQAATVTTFTIEDTDTANISVSDATTTVLSEQGPAISGTTAGQDATDIASLQPFAGVTIADDPGQIETVTISFTPGNGVLSNTGNGSYNGPAGQYTDTGTAAQVTADLQALTFTPTAGIPGQNAVTTTFTIADTDTAGLSATDATTSVITQAGPAITGAQAGQAAVGLAPVTPFANVTIADDPSQTDTITITLSSHANGTLSNLIEGNYNAATGVYTVTDSAPALTTVLNALVFTPAQGIPGHSAVTTTFTISDTDTAGLTATDTTTSVITQSGPAISGASAGQSVADTGTITPFAHLTLADDVSQTETVTVTLSAHANGTLSHLGGGTYNANTGVYSITGSASTVTTALDALVFTPAQGTPGHSAITTGFTVATTDTAGLSASNNTTSVITQSGPAISGASAGQSVAGTGTITPFAHLTLADDVSQTETVTVTLSAHANGTLSHLGGGTYNANTGVYSITGSASAVTTALDGLVFTPAQGTPGHSAVTTTFTISDTDTVGLSATDATTSVLAQSGPAISGASAGQSFADTGTITPFAHLTLADDISQTETVTVTLSASANGTLSNLGGGSYNASTGVYSITGSASAVTTALDALVFTPVHGTPGHAALTTSFTVATTDTVRLSATDGTTSVISQSGPAISGASAGQSLAANGTITPLAHVTLADDISQTETVTVTLSNPANGTLSHLGGGSYNANTGVYSIAGSASAVTTALDALVFTPAQGIPGQSAVATTFTISDTDTAGLNATDAITSVLAQSGPAISGASAGQSIAGTGTILPFAHVTIADDASQSETVTITLANPANGTLSHLGSGSYNANTGVYSISGGAAAVTSVLDALVFTPAQGTPGHSAVTTTFTVATTDTAGLTATDTTTSVITQSGPAISGASANQSITGAITPFAHLTLADDVSQTETVTVTLSAHANGTLSHLGGGTYNANTGVYSITGSASTVTTALDALVFTPAQGTPGHSAITTGFTVATTDTAGLSASNNTTSVITQSGPAISGASANQSITGAITPFGHLTLADDASQTETVTVTLSAHANGTLSHLGGGSYNANTGVYSITGSASAVTTALDALVFTPAQGTPGHSAVTTGFTVATTDTAGLSASDNTTSVIAQSGPAISGASPGQSIADTGTITPLAHLTLADDVSQTETVTVTLSNPANGTLSHLGGGSYNANTGVYSATGSASAVMAALEALVFAPAIAPAGRSVTTTFSISDIDTAGLTATDSSTSVIAIGAPAINGTAASQAIANGGTVNPFSAASIGDAVGQTETVSLTLSSTANGTLSNLGGGSYNANTGVYTDAGSATAVTSDLQGLIFTSGQPRLTVGHTLTTSFTVNVTDSLGLTTTDTTTSIVQAGTTPAKSIPNDFTGSGTSDVLFENSNTGLVLYWQVHNDAVQQGVPVAGAAAGWNIVGTGDFTGSGTSDILFQNSQSGLVLYWQMHNGTLQQGVPIAGAAAGWNLIGTGDFTGSGTDDILFQNSQSGLVLYWQMQNGALQQGVPIAGASAGWQFLGTGDFTGNGVDDLLFENTSSGLLLYWHMQNGALQQGVPIAGATSDWKYAGTGDFTGSGTDDILFQNKNSGALLDWHMVNGALAGGGIIGTLPAGYQVAATGNYSGTATSDILLQNPTTGSYVEWKMANGSLSQQVTLGGASSDWKPVG